ncbi:unnamed protein product [Owenia fusiformis]|uniref:Protein FAM92A n=1 Tax=Owenia fusiformis TaxID=6347 RepID=A0A8S4NDY1_OWEFU|nr:unnamed protein product [Owenia fusiformis]
MNRNNAEIRASENQSKFIQDRITAVEKHFGEMCFHFGALARKNAKLRDKGDEVAKHILTYAENESLNHSSRHALTKFSENLAAVQDYRNAQTQRIEAKVVSPLSLYGSNCKHAKEDLKAAFTTRDKEIKEKEKLEKVKDKAPSDRHKISKLESELQKASTDASLAERALEEKIDMFEKKKLEDIKKVLQDFVLTELSFHCKAVESYTQCYQALQNMNEEDDLEEFRNSLRPSSAASRGLGHGVSKSSLNTTAQSLKNTPSGRRAKSNQKQTVQYDDEDDDDDEEDDDSYEDDDEEYTYDRRFNAR